MFYFEQVLQTALSGIDSRGITTAALQIAGVVLILSLLYSVFEAYSNGGDVRALGIAGLKYLILGLVFVNYPAVFRSVNAMFSSIADFMYNLNGIGDVFNTWDQSLSGWVGQNGASSFWSLVIGKISGLLSMLVILAGFIILPIAYTVFTLAYALYGSVLYVVGPFILALLPSRGMGQLARTYVLNLMTFQAWGLIYAIIQVLMTAINLNSVQSVVGSNSVLNAFVGSSQMLLLGAVSILFSMSIAIIPFVASRIVRGDVGSTMLLMISGVALAGDVAARTLFGAAGGVNSGRAQPPEGAPAPPSNNGSSIGGVGSGSSLAGSTGAPRGAGLVESKSSTSGSGQGDIADTSTRVPSASNPGEGISATSDNHNGGSPTVLWNPSTGQVFSWNGSGWEGAGHVSNPSESSLIQASGGKYGITRWAGGAIQHGPGGPHYSGPRSIASIAAWTVGTGIGRTMRAVGMGKQA